VRSEVIDGFAEEVRFVVMLANLGKAALFRTGIVTINSQDRYYRSF
jgi:hypothetical protein